MGVSIFGKPTSYPNLELVLENKDNVGKLTYWLRNLPEPKDSFQRKILSEIQRCRSIVEANGRNEESIGDHK